MDTDAPLRLWAAVEAALDCPAPPRAEAIAHTLGISRARVANLARLRNLPESIIELIRSKRLSLKHGEWLLKLPASKRERVGSKAAAAKWTVAQLRKQISLETGVRPEDSPNPDSDMAALEERLSGLLSTRVEVAHRTGGDGWLKIRYADLDCLEGVLERLGYRS